MNRRTNTALKIAGIALASSGLGGLLAGCGGSDSDGGSSDEPPKVTSKEAFCTQFTGLAVAVGDGKPSDSSAAIERVMDWYDEMEDYGPPSELSDDERDGFGTVMSMFEDIDEDSTLQDLQALETDIPAADRENVRTFSTWVTSNCLSSTPPSPSAS